MTDDARQHPDDEGSRQERFIRLLDPIHDNLARFARAMTDDHEEARDLMSETITTAFEQFDRLRDHAAFLSYLFTIAHRIANRRRRRLGIFSALDHRKVERLHSTATPPDVAADVGALHAALALLPREQREAVALFELSGLSLEEIREIQGGTLSGVKARVARGRRKLAALLGINESIPGLKKADEGHETDMLDNGHLLYSNTNAHG